MVYGVCVYHVLYLASTPVDRVLTAQELTSLVIVDLHSQASGGVAVEMDGRKVQVCATGREHSPYLVLAIFHRRACFALWDVVFGMATSSSDAPPLTRHLSWWVG
jgi:hypothetical protein